MMLLLLPLFTPLAAADACLFIFRQRDYFITPPLLMPLLPPLSMADFRC